MCGSLIGGTRSGGTQVGRGEREGGALVQEREEEQECDWQVAWAGERCDTWHAETEQEGEVQVAWNTWRAKLDSCLDHEILILKHGVDISPQVKRLSAER